MPVSTSTSIGVSMALSWPSLAFGCPFWRSISPCECALCEPSAYYFRQTPELPFYIWVYSQWMCTHNDCQSKSKQLPQCLRVSLDETKEKTVWKPSEMLLTGSLTYFPTLPQKLLSLRSQSLSKHSPLLHSPPSGSSWLFCPTKIPSFSMGSFAYPPQSSLHLLAHKISHQSCAIAVDKIGLHYCLPHSPVGYEKWYTRWTCCIYTFLRPLPQELLGGPAGHLPLQNLASPNDSALWNQHHVPQISPTCQLRTCPFLLKYTYLPLSIYPDSASFTPFHILLQTHFLSAPLSF